MKRNSTLCSPKESMRCIVITGASSGIGAALARLCLDRGWNVLAVARREERLRSLAEHPNCAVLALDVTSSGAAARIVNEAMRRFSRIDVVFNNAGVAHPGPLLEQTDAAIEAQW